jgi:hypothetical protein
MDKDAVLRAQLIELLKGKNAHIDFDSAVGDFPVKLVNQRVNQLPYSAWQVLEHMRIAQWDILEFSRNGDHVSPPWPSGYWPAGDEAADSVKWQESVEAFRSDRKQMEDLLANPSTDLFAPLPHGDGQTTLREALLLADHNAYHLGVLMAIKRGLAAGA